MNCGNNNFIWIILILLFCCNGNGFNGIFGGCGNDNCSWIIILIILFCCCGNGFNLCDNKC